MEKYFQVKNNLNLENNLMIFQPPQVRLWYRALGNCAQTLGIQSTMSTNEAQTIESDWNEKFDTQGGGEMNFNETLDVFFTLKTMPFANFRKHV